MRRFQYYLYENFDAERLSTAGGNPRSYQNSKTDGILSEIAGFPPFSCDYNSLCGKYAKREINDLINIGLLRKSGQ
ncbi:MAG TPA: hypothetical protein VN512_10555 [Clostridia bacterium]|nr:hypothetical protein [Clostridia bacterium]